MNEENLNFPKRLFFTALGIDIAVTAIVAMSAFWTIDALKEMQSGARTYSPSLGDSFQFWENFARLVFLTLIGVGLALVKWLNACYRFAKDSIGASGFKNEGWTAWAWIVPIINLFKPYQIINEIYKAGAPGYRNPDDWKKESGSGLLLTWWIFWVVTHLFFATSLNAMGSKASLDDLTMPQVLGLLNLQIGVCVLSIVIAAMWFFVVNHLTGRLIARRESRVSDKYSGTDYSSLNRNSDVTVAVQSRGPSHIGAVSKAKSHPHAPPANTTTVSERQMQAPQSTPSAITESSNEEDQWATAMAELETGQRRPGLWAKAFAESEGDETKAKVAYLKSRVQQLLDAAKAQAAQWEAERQAVEIKAKAEAMELQRSVNSLVKEFESSGDLTTAEIQLLVRNVAVNRRIIGIVDYRANTLLHLCVKNDMPEEVHALLQAGADPKLSNNNGQQPEFLTENPLILKLLRGLTISTDQLKEELAALIAKGRCPNSNCGAIIPLDSLECPQCHAVFGQGSSWNVIPLIVTDS